MKRVVVTDPNTWPWVADRLRNRLDSPEAAPGLDGIELEYRELGDPELLERLAGAWAYVGVQLDSRLAAATPPSLALVQVAAAGVDHLALDALPAGIPVANSGGHGRSIAEHVLMVVLALRRRLLDADAALRRGVWRSKLADPASPLLHTLEGVRVGVIGFGHTGRAIAGLCQAVGMEVAGLRRSAEHRRHDDPDASWVDGMSALPELLAWSDVVVLACPLTPETTGLIGAAELDALGPNGVVVNVARGAVIDEEALFTALTDHRIAGAALDVWWAATGSADAPPSRFDFGLLDTVVMTPHNSATAEETYRDRADDILDDLEDALAARPPRHLVLTTGTVGR